VTNRAVIQEKLFGDTPRSFGRTSESGSAPDLPPEVFVAAAEPRVVERRVALRSGRIHATRFVTAGAVRRSTKERELAALADAAFLQLSQWPEIEEGSRTVRCADLFSGCGLMTLGGWEACRAIGKLLEPVVAFDRDPSASAVYKKNFPGASVIIDPIETVISGTVAAASTPSERAFAKRIGTIELLLAGPPCQGHSDLNNHTRRNDPKNGLYDRVARFAELVSPPHVIVENVPAVLHDRGRIVEKTIAALIRLGYSVDHAVVDLSALGVPQRRRRHVLVGSLTRTPNIKAVVSRYWTPSRSVGWAIGDLSEITPDTTFDQAAKATVANQKRIDYLFRHKRFDLPDHVRPDCHKLKDHSYKSVYGRLDWDAPAQTITTGFTCMGQGRFVHPRQKRTLTPHEAARLQFIPDFFRFPADLKRTALARMIGNAVPAKLTFVMALELIR
jgi:DNA (cytosine-5)-methyltransferase 1